MRCHARAAAPPSQTLSYLWISDDLLTDAFNRFARVSHATRRYGSNVPGPLEARRRSAKRRMGMVTASAIGSAPSAGFDLSALFGLRSSKPPDQSWKWEAPDLCRSLQIGPPPPPPPLLSSAWPLGLEDGDRVQSGLYDEVHTVEPVSASKKAMEVLMDALSTPKTVDCNDIQPLIEFLHGCQDEPKAHNVMRLSQWLKSRVVTKQAIKLLDQVVREKLKMEVMELDEASDYIAYILRENEIDTMPRVSAILESSSINALKDIACSVTRSCLQELPESGPSADIPMTALWLDCLWRCDSLQGWHHRNTVWTAIYSMLATRMAPSDLSFHFHRLNPWDLCRVLLDIWVPTHGQADQQDITTHRSFRSLKQVSPANQEVNVNAMLVDLEATQAQYDKPNLQKSLVDLLVIIYRHHGPYEYFFDNIFEILRARPSTAGKQAMSRRMFKFVMAIWRHDDLGIPESHATRLIEYFLDGRDDIISLRMAWHVFVRVPSVPLRLFQEFPLKMAKAGAGPLEVFQLLQRRIGEESVAPELGLEAKMTLSQEHIDLVHLLAHHWAHGPQSTCRVAYRRVWACYRYLQDRGAPLTDTMSRSMVHAGALRFLLEGRRIPTEQFRYILTLVRKLEGVDVAEELDRAMWAIWAHRFRPALRLQSVQRLRNLIGDDHGEPQRSALFKFKHEPWSRLSFKNSMGPWRPWFSYRLPNPPQGFAGADNISTKDNGSLSVVGSSVAEGKHVTTDVGNGDRRFCTEASKSIASSCTTETSAGRWPEALNKSDHKASNLDQDTSHDAVHESSLSSDDVLLCGNLPSSARNGSLVSSTNQPSCPQNYLNGPAQDHSDESLSLASSPSPAKRHNPRQVCDLGSKQEPTRTGLDTPSERSDLATSSGLYAKDVHHVTNPVVELEQIVRVGQATGSRAPLSPSLGGKRFFRPQLVTTASSTLSDDSHSRNIKATKSRTSSRPRPGFYTLSRNLSDNACDNPSSAKDDQGH
nr:hypothetical protein CFP56_42200 [Quercus suber]